MSIDEFPVNLRQSLAAGNRERGLVVWRKQLELNDLLGNEGIEIRMNKEPLRVGVSRLLPLRLLTRIAHGKQVEWCHAEVRVSPPGEIMIPRIECPRLAASKTVVQLVSYQRFGDYKLLGRLFLPVLVHMEDLALPRVYLCQSGTKRGGSNTV